MHLIADFLIRSIIRTRLFNDYLNMKHLEAALNDVSIAD